MLFSTRPRAMISAAPLRSPILLALAITAFLCASALPAYIDHLSEDEVDEAYAFAQRHDQDVVQFFKVYEQSFPNAAPGIHVSRIAIRTPFCSVVENAFEKGSIYPMSRAREDYAADPYPFAAMVSVSTPFAAPWTPAQLADPNDNFWKQFTVELSQDRKISPSHISARPLFSFGSDRSNLVGAELRLEYGVREVASKLLQIRVTGPGNERVTAEFDLDKLR